MPISLSTFRKALLLLLLPFHLSAQDTSEGVFTDIYQQGAWGKQWYSGIGSEMQFAKEYVVYIQAFLTKHNIQTVLDLGCGDWQFSKHINWSGIRYTGCDVVKRIIDQNQERFASPTITFIHLDALTTDLPEADLLLCKDVLQHLSNSDIQHLLPQLKKFKHCLITNYIYPGDNYDIPRGSYRPLDLLRPPFTLAGERVLTYPAGYTTKQVVHLQTK